MIVLPSVLSQIPSLNRHSYRLIRHWLHKECAMHIKIDDIGTQIIKHMCIICTANYNHQYDTKFILSLFLIAKNVKFDIC